MLVTRGLAVLALVLNVFSMGWWILKNPPAAYERAADRELREAHSAYRKVSPAQSYALFRKVIDDYPRSTSATEALFHAGRAAFLGLGRFAEAEQALARYLETNPGNEAQRNEAQEYLNLIRDRTDIAEESRDEALWEYVQALADDGNGKSERAVKRLDWLIERFRTSALGRKSEGLRLQVVARIAR